jgi:hypothetical protein
MFRICFATPNARTATSRSFAVCVVGMSLRYWRGYSRDGEPAEPQIVYGLLCTPEGCPVAVEVFPVNMADPKTFSQ